MYRRVYDEIRGNLGVIFASLTGIATTSTVFLIYSMGVFVKPLSAAFGWQRQEVLGALTATLLGILPSTLLAGWLSDRFSNWRLIAISQALLGLTCFLLGAFTSQHIWSFYALYFLAAVVSTGALPVTFTRQLAIRFVHNRGLVMGIAASGTGISALLIPPFAAFVLTHSGWRSTYFALGLVPLLASVPTMLFLRGSSTSVATRAAALREPSRLAESGPGLAAALRNARFWLLGVASFLGAAVAVGISSNLVPHFTDMGYGVQAAAWAASLFGLSMLIGRITIGALLDRFRATGVALVVLVAGGFASMALASDKHLPNLIVPIALVGIATGAEIDFLSYFVPKYFGLRDLGKIYGCTFVLFNAGAAVGPKFFGYIFDTHKSYGAAFLVGGGAWLLAGVLLWLLRQHPFELKAPIR
jgi:MFS family permease